MNILIFCDQRDCKYCSINTPLFYTNNTDTKKSKCCHPSPKISQFGKNCSSKNERLPLPKELQ